MKLFGRSTYSYLYLLRRQGNSFIQVETSDLVPSTQQSRFNQSEAGWNYSGLLFVRCPKGPKDGFVAASVSKYKYRINQGTPPQMPPTCIFGSELIKHTSYSNCDTAKIHQLILDVNEPLPALKRLKFQA